MRTYVKNFYERLIGKCDDFAKSCTQDEIVLTLVIMFFSIASGILVVYVIDQ
ncbi:hypothetical protein [Christiangramia echinicola]|uniref:Uncharacterized protein n=1 Tax=Christiangramia echinicola TaxID=279359 RepID=A0A1H1SE59_9FLAO|nr:hypothetical protein [Christiangramia echinicola]SDS46153.1 hypothetical protein SAMN04488552_3237 [Christiangramia echinicola]